MEEWLRESGAIVVLPAPAACCPPLGGAGMPAMGGSSLNLQNLSSKILVGRGNIILAAGGFQATSKMIPDARAAAGGGLGQPYPYRMGPSPVKNISSSIMCELARK
eukprot:scaffold145073_cov35-Tisochrysis_lutea.AAC.2